jgi:hypothetical protein
VVFKHEVFIIFRKDFSNPEFTSNIPEKIERAIGIGLSMRTAFKEVAELVVNFFACHSRIIKEGSKLYKLENSKMFQLLKSAVKKTDFVF